MELDPLDHLSLNSIIRDISKQQLIYETGIGEPQLHKRGGDRMNSGHSTPSHVGLPHLSHAEPWAHNFICCDSEHQASSSTSRGSTPLNRFPTRHQSHPSISTNHSFNTATACCDETQCSAGDVVECCDDPGCSQGAVCEDEGCHEPHTSQSLGGFDNSAQSMKELEEWACSKEGCHAIQQYVSLSLVGVS